MASLVVRRFFNREFFQTFPGGFSSLLDLILLFFVFFELDLACLEQIRVEVVKDLTDIECQAVDGLVPVVPSISLYGREDDGQDHLTVLLDQALDVVVVPQK